MDPPLLLDFIGDVRGVHFFLLAGMKEKVL